MKVLTDRQFRLLPLVLMAPPLALGLCALTLHRSGQSSTLGSEVRVSRYASQAAALNRTTASLRDILDQRNQPVDWAALGVASRVKAPAPDVPVVADQPSEFTLQGIAWHEGRPLAFLNNRVFTVNDEVGGCRVSAITEQGVVLVDAAGKDRILTLYDSITQGKDSAHEAMP